MARFGQLSYGQREKQFIGQPVEDIAMANQVLQERYHTNRDNIEQLQILEQNLDVIEHDKDKAVVREQIQATNDRIEGVTESGRYEHAGETVRDIYKHFQTNQGLQRAINNRQIQKETFAQIDEREDLSARYRGIAKQMSMYGYEGVQQDPETGEWTGSFNGFIPPEAVDTTKLADDILKGINANKNTQGGFWDVAGAEAQAATQMYIEKTGHTIEEIEHDRVMHIVGEYLKNSPEAVAWNEAKAEMDYFSDFVQQGITPTIEDVAARNFSKRNLNIRLLETERDEDETDDEFKSRVNSEYMDAVESEVQDRIDNTISEFEEMGIEYDMESVMASAYKQSLINESIQADMDILANKYGYQKSDIIHDIKVNEWNKSLNNRNKDLHIRIGKGSSVPINTSEIYKTFDRVNSDIEISRKKIEGLRNRLNSENNLSDIEREGIEGQIYDYESKIRNLEAEKNNYDRIIDNLREKGDPELIVRQAHGGYIEIIREVAGDSGVEAFTNNIKGANSFEIFKNIIGEEDYKKIKDKMKEERDEVIERGGILPSVRAMHYDFEGGYNSALARYKQTINKRSQENPQHIETFAIFTQGHEGFDFLNESIEQSITNNLEHMTDISTGTLLEGSEIYDAIKDGADVSVTPSGITRQGTNELAFHVTAEASDGEKEHAIIALADIEDRTLINSYLQHLDEFANSESVPDDMRKVTRDYINSSRGYIMPSTGYANVGTAIQSLQLHTFDEFDNFKSGNPEDLIDTPVGKMRVIKDRSGRYRVKLMTFDEGGNKLSDLNLADFAGVRNFASPEQALKFLPEVARRESRIPR